MRFVLFYHSLVSDWNHGNAHFLRGFAAALQDRGHDVRIYEPADAWSRRNLLQDQGPDADEAYRAAYPTLTSTRYTLGDLDLDAVLDGADLVLAHEWNDPELIARLGEHRRRRDYRLLFHDTHHRAVSAPEQMARYDLTHFDGALVFGEVLRDIYRRNGWTGRTWTWHEAADTRVFRPLPAGEPEGDLVWIGNWGDDERTAELDEFLLSPARDLKLAGTIHGVRYPAHAVAAVLAAGFQYRGYLPNHRVPELFARHRFTVHVPRRPYVRMLPGIPTIRIFETLACGIPLICSPWDDAEGLFHPGRDYLVARTGDDMRELMRYLLDNPAEASVQAQRGLDTILSRHTCVHRVDELLAICAQLGLPPICATDGAFSHPANGRVRPAQEVHA